MSGHTQKKLLTKPHMKEMPLWIVGFLVMNKIEYKTGQVLNGCIYLKEAPRKDPKRRRALFECKCTTKFEANIDDVKTGNTNSCGCYNIESSIKAATKHGLRGSKLYPIWRCMKQRCYKPNDDRYKYYGGRGIHVCDEWIESFKAFHDYVIYLPNAQKEGHSLDRKENDGNYEPDNMRWVDGHTQMANRRVQKSNTSGYTGVYQTKSGKYKSYITVNKNIIKFGLYDSLEGAVKVRDKYIIDNGLNEYPLSGL